MAFDIISEIGFGEPIGFVQTGSDVGGLIKNLHDALPAFGILSRLHPFTSWVKQTWIGNKYLVARPENNSGIGMVMRFRDKLVQRRIDEVRAGKAYDRVDLLQTYQPPPQ